MSHKSLSLHDKYTLDEGTIILTGVQALVRLPIDQHKADQRADLNTATFISGYRGSPVGGLDFLLQQNAALLDAHQIHFEPGINEDLAATAVFGSQSTHFYPGAQYDGVVGMWYGKGPGVDRTGDVFRHANFAGVDKHGGVLAIAGDDPLCKSSTIPSASEVALFDAQMPVLYPGTVQEIIEMGRYGFELSRYSGLWTGLKLVTNVADGYTSAHVSPIMEIQRPEWTFDGRPWSHSQNMTLLAPHSLTLEREIQEGRLIAAQHFAYENHLNQIVVTGADDWIGLVAAGKSYYDLREALSSVGIGEKELRHYGIRLLKLGMIHPLEPKIIKQFARGVEEVLVIEEKRGFVETQLRDLLYNEPSRPIILGKQDQEGNPLVKSYSELTPDELVIVLASRLAKRVPSEHFAQRLALLQNPSPTSSLNGVAPTLNRTPYFCSGCPHNRSTVIPEGSIAGGGIGCHGMALLMPDQRALGITHMGGEGVQWVGAAPFSSTEHFFQNLGDGTLFHSGYLAIRQAIAARVNITYKILYNGTVAMTGGQHADGEMPVPELTRALHAEGVSKIMVVSADPDSYGSATFAPKTTIWHRDRLDDAQEILKETLGVSILIYDQACATELRRQRKRGTAVQPHEYIYINESVCEGCGDCGVKSNCLSVFPIETEFGRKTQIHQGSCNKDYTCVEGNCPAFIKVVPSTRQSAVSSSGGSPAIPHPPDTLHEPPRIPSAANLYMTGIGGTGVVTITQILATAALLDDKQITSLDQTGLSQKGGPVVSHLKIMADPEPVSNLIGAGEADGYLVFDVLSGTTDVNLRRAHPDRTVAVVSSSQIPTGHMVRDVTKKFPQGTQLKARIDAVTKAEQNVYLDAIELSELLFGGHMQANMITIGAAYQVGLLPLSEESIGMAIELNGVAVEQNKAAFWVGRAVVAEPEWVTALTLNENVISNGTSRSTHTNGTTRPNGTSHTNGVTHLNGSAALPALSFKALSPNARQLIESVGAEGELHRLLTIRVPELIAYQNVGYARQYVDFVDQVAKAEPDGKTDLSEAVARYLYKLMAYKDEYEVARLHLRDDLEQSIAKAFGPEAQIAYQLQPPILKALGMERKISVGGWFNPIFRLLTKLKWLRRTPLDIFGYDHVRRVERELIPEYRNLIQEILPKAQKDTSAYEQAVTLASLPDMIRGYDEVKLDRVKQFRAEVKQIMDALA
ncbi:MAG: indolepyruvate ferredoxin oxidoreductase family protein [Chloroflexota bacterium]